MLAYTHTCTHTYVRTYVHTYIHIHMSTYMYTYIQRERERERERETRRAAGVTFATRAACASTVTVMVHHVLPVNPVYSLGRYRV